MNAKECLEQWNSEPKLRSMITEMAQGKMSAFVEPTVQYLKGEITQHLTSFGEINDDDDVEYYTAIQYVELKARWIQLNLRLSYQAFSSGEGDPQILLKASATAALLGSLEPYISERYVQEIQTLLAQPVFGEALTNAS